MEQNISNNQEKKNEKNNTGLIIAIIAAVTVVLVIAIVLVGKSIANKKIAEINEKAEIVEQIEPEDNTEELFHMCQVPLEEYDSNTCHCTSIK